MTEDNIREELLAALASSDAETQRAFTAGTTPVPTGHDLLTFPTPTPLPASIPHSHHPTPAPAPIHPDLPPFPAAAAVEYQQSPDAKRSRELDLFDEENDAKRQKTEQDFLPALKAEPEHGLDLERMLESALATYDINPPANTTIDEAPLNAPEPPRARSPSVPTGSHRVENSIMKASSNSGRMIKSMSIPLLGNIAVQILLRLSQQSRQETEDLLADQNSEFQRDYQSLISMFLPARKIFSTSPLFFPEELNISDSDDCETIRVTNLATIAASTFGADNVSLADVHKSFFSIFIPEDSGYEDSLTELFLGLKTHVFIESLNEREGSQHVMSLLDQIFPVDFAESLTRRSGDVVLNANEELLVRRIIERREDLLKLANNEYIRSGLALSPIRTGWLTFKAHLKSQFPPNQFAEDFSTFLRGHLSMVVDYADKYGVNIPLSQDDTAAPQIHEQNHDDEQFGLAALLQSNLAETGLLGNADTASFLDDMPSALDPNIDLTKLIEQSLSSHKAEANDELMGHMSSHDSVDSGVPKDLASLIQEKLGGGNADKVPDGLQNLPPSYPTNGHDPSHGNHSQFLSQLNHGVSATYQQYTALAAPTPSTGADGEILPPNQSESTSVLYERARQAAVAKSSNTSRREGLHSTRRPWTSDEEKALMTGLDMVKGPHWSQILSIFGANGSHSQILKDRTQVQLKDKARNLKLFFLKTNSEMPYYLQSVTGELKTRAPSQAARKEAEEKARQNREVELATIQTMSLLGGGLQNNNHRMDNGLHANSPASRGSPLNPGLGHASTVMNSASGHTNGTSAAHVSPSPLVKSEAPDHHPLHQLSKLQQIQPAPGPGTAVAPAPMAQMQTPLKIQPQTSQRVHQAPSHHQQQLLPAASPQRAPPHMQAHANTVNHQNYNGLPPMPPNHHSSPDQTQDAQSQDAKLFEALSAAVADSHNELTTNGNAIGTPGN
ncbi:telomere repeat binding factor-domain-containing protein [Cercophora newfieldiana]|uniref:Telomere repeat binding factor-domain-containing protein n=1 Tax=Cercophora newfieldiana TaxID=92897 RepID=A0AA39YFF7_9PEZI|nr:telomere repeat binding factor-domain-containing protein [Cercophora newfieldiana]